MARSHIATAAIAALASLVSLSSVRADELPDDKMAPYQFSGVINADNVYVRSYSSENDYPVVKLSKGDAVVVVGSRFDYLKILPPSDAYCLVGKAWVEVRGDGSVGRVREEAANNANVRIGSTLVPSYGKVVTQAKPGSDVKILGQQEEYFKIAPPAGAFVYVNKRFVDLVKRVEVVEDHNAMVVKQPGNGQEANNVPPVKPVPPPPGPGPDNVKVPATDPDGGLKPVPPIPTPPVVDIPTTQTAPAPADAGIAKTDTAGFTALEAKFKAATELPLAQQPLDELITGYQKVVDDKSLPDPTLKLADYRLTGLKLRKDAADTISGAGQKQRQAAQVPLEAEAKEIKDRMASNEFKHYAAVGTLRTSALPYNGKTLYRLTDPQSGRTVIYVTDTAGNLSQFDGQFVGVKGPITDDTGRQIKLITPQAVEAVDPAELAKGTLSSGLVPPSLTPAAH